MTENEIFDAMLDEAWDEHEELLAYRAIGTVEEIQQKLAELDRWHTSEVNANIKNVFANTSTSICHNCDHKDEYIEELEAENAEYKSIGTIEDFKALKEMNTPYKPQKYEDRYYACKCDNILLPKWRKYPTELMPKSEGLPHCMACGQKLDWSERREQI